jgi:hypothetical protein
MRARRSKAPSGAADAKEREASLGVRQDATLTRIEVAGGPYPAGLRPTMRSRLRSLMSGLAAPLGDEKLTLSADERRNLSAQRHYV